MMSYFHCIWRALIWRALKNAAQLLIKQNRGTLLRTFQTGLSYTSSFTDPKRYAWLEASETQISSFPL